MHLGEYDTRTSIDCLADGNPENTSTCKPASVIIDVDRVIPHKGFGDGLLRGMPRIYDSNDIALVKLKKRVAFTPDIQPICLPQKQPESSNFIVAGWSRSSNQKIRGFDQKLMSGVAQVDQATCEAIPVLPFVTEDHICVGANTEQRACIADAGGPLMAYEQRDDGTVTVTVYGISYMDLSCDRTDLPGVFTRVNEYMPWIRQQIDN